MSTDQRGSFTAIGGAAGDAGVLVDGGASEFAWPKQAPRSEARSCIAASRPTIATVLVIPGPNALLIVRPTITRSAAARKRRPLQRAVGQHGRCEPRRQSPEFNTVAIASANRRFQAPLSSVETARRTL